MNPALDMLLREDITLWIITGICSLLVGSFLNVIIARIPRQIIWSEAEKSARGEKPPGIVSEYATRRRRVEPPLDDREGRSRGQIAGSAMEASNA